MTVMGSWIVAIRSLSWAESVAIREALITAPGSKLGMGGAEFRTGHCTEIATELPGVPR